MNQEAMSELLLWREDPMRVKVTEECIACELCTETCPEVFEMGDEYARVIVETVPQEHEEAVCQAADECPAEAIIVTEK